MNCSQRKAKVMQVNTCCSCPRGMMQKNVAPPYKGPKLPLESAQRLAEIDRTVYWLVQLRAISNYHD